MYLATAVSVRLQILFMALQSTNNSHEKNDINPHIVEEIKKMLDQYNPLVKTFRHARDLLEQYKGLDISIRIIRADKVT